ncbi:MAG: flagellar assembly protein FliW [Deltaproteobacteria bacterium]|nr:flagellar assembly protein FliW [Deltaproteobacteria bacterium]
MRVQSSRFGVCEVEKNAVIRFPRGLIGFPRDTGFVLLRRDASAPVGWLQSISNANLAFPVVSIEALEVEFPAQHLEELATSSGVAASNDSCAIMAVITASGARRQATVNLLSPIIVNSETRTGAQVVLERSPYSTQEPFQLRRRATHVPTPAAHAAPPSP